MGTILDPVPTANFIISLILIIGGLLIYHGKMYRLITWHEILERYRFDIDRLAKTIRNAFFVLAVLIIITPIVLTVLHYETYVEHAMGLLSLISILYISLMGIRRLD